MRKGRADAAASPTVNVDLGGDWRDWIIAHALLQEAESLIKGRATPKGNSIKE